LQSASIAAISEGLSKGIQKLAQWRRMLYRGAGIPK
jgi:hypothetical protein